MLGELTTFLVFWCIVLISLTAFGFVMFNQTPNYKHDFLTIFFRLFEASIGFFDDTIFDTNFPTYEGEHYVGRSFYFIVLLLNLVLLMNLLIGILTKIYEYFN